jgi:oligopeptide transport system substrate-binding protein
MKICSLLLLLCILFSCSEHDAPRFEHAGGSINLALDNKPTTYIPRKAKDYYSAAILNQVMECLVIHEAKSMEIAPQIAASWEIDAKELTYTFTIREGVKFHPHRIFTNEESRILTTEDIKKSIELSCQKTEEGIEPVGYSIVFKDNLLGANDFYNGKAESISGLKIDGQKVSFTLIQKDNNFLNKLAHISCAIISKKIHDSNLEQDMIGTGPFRFLEFKQGEPSSIVLARNEQYYLKDKNGFSLPYIDSLIFTIQNKKLEQLAMFEAKKMDIIAGLPTSRITKMLEGRIEDFNSIPPLLILNNNPLLETKYYFFNMKDERFKDPRVRQAFNYAVDKDKIGISILRDQYWDLGYYGIVPPVTKAFRGYDFEGVKNYGYKFDPEKARQLLAEAGYPNGEGFGSVDLRFNIDDIQSVMADEFSRQIFRVLNINVNIDGSTFEQLETDASNGTSPIFRSGWVADYPSPETFLTNFYGKNVPSDPNVASYINQSRYVNPAFDALFEKARQSPKMIDQMKYFSLAEQELLKNPPIIPLWYSADYQVVHSYVRNLHYNALNFFDFRHVYLKEWTKEEFLQKMEKKK